jgi:hypothetical protein
MSSTEPGSTGESHSGNPSGASTAWMLPIFFYGRLHVLACRATLDVPRELAQFVASLLSVRTCFAEITSVIVTVYETTFNDERYV